MNDVLVQHTNWNLLHSSASDRAAETKNALGQAQSYLRQKRYYAHVDFGIEQVIKGLFAGGVPKCVSTIFLHQLRILERKYLSDLLHCQLEQQNASVPLL